MAAAPYALDSESAEWLGELTTAGGRREAAIARLHALLLRIARAEARPRSGRFDIAGPELDDLAHQAAADAVLAIVGKLGDFRGESRFTTWAYKFVMFEVSAKFARHAWRHRTVPIGPPDGAGSEPLADLPDRFGVDPAESAQSRDLAEALRRAVQHDLTARQREVFVPLVLGGVPLDELARELGTTRGTLYKVLFDARRKLRTALVRQGYLDGDRWTARQR